MTQLDPEDRHACIRVPAAHLQEYETTACLYSRSCVIRFMANEFDLLWFCPGNSTLKQVIPIRYSFFLNCHASLYNLHITGFVLTACGAGRSVWLFPPAPARRTARLTGGQVSLDQDQIVSDLPDA
ncbi:MAG: hypothetical protein II437_01205, partial [Oscillospiraceae bacterium]|nr:hypothetical protein [Oscillospiraceae bacterium]